METLGLTPLLEERPGIPPGPALFSAVLETQWDKQVDKKGEAGREEELQLPREIPSWVRQSENGRCHRWWDSAGVGRTRREWGACGAVTAKACPSGLLHCCSGTCAVTVACPRGKEPRFSWVGVRIQDWDGVGYEQMGQENWWAVKRMTGPQLWNRWVNCLRLGGQGGKERTVRVCYSRIFSWSLLGALASWTLGLRTDPWFSRDVNVGISFGSGLKFLLSTREQYPPGDIWKCVRGSFGCHRPVECYWPKPIIYRTASQRKIVLPRSGHLEKVMPGLWVPCRHYILTACVLPNRDRLTDREQTYSCQRVGGFRAGWKRWWD